MKTVKTYIKPEAELVSPKYDFMLDLPVSDTFVDDEAANKGTFDEESEDEFEPFFDEQ